MAIVIQLEPKKFWEQLLFLDDQNYGGIQVQGSLSQEEEQQNMAEADDTNGGEGAGASNIDTKERNRDDEGDSDSDQDEPSNKGEDSEGLQDSEDEDAREEDEGEGSEGGPRARRLRPLKGGNRSWKKKEPHQVIILARVREERNDDGYTCGGGILCQ